MALIVGAIGLTRAQASARDPAAQAATWLDRVQYTWGSSHDWADLVDSTDAVVRLRVTNVQGPIWNSSDGRAWDGNESVPPMVYSVVRGTVEELWEGEASGPEIELIILGDARRHYEGAAPPPYAAISGGFEVDEAAILLLERRTFQLEQGPVDSWTLRWHFEGNWRVEGSFAITSIGNEVIPVEAIRQLLKGAWAARDPHLV